jgi:hypothetical protein
MAEGLEIRITTPGMEKFGELRDNLRKLKKELQDLIPGTNDFAKKSKEVSQTQDRVNAALRQGWSESAKVKDAYFRTGLEVRQLILSSGVLNKATGMLVDTFSTAALNASQLRRATGTLGVSMGGPLTVAIGLAAGALTYFLGEMKTGEKTVDDFKKSLEDLTKSQLEQQLAMAELAQAGALGKEAVSKAGFGAAGVGGAWLGSVWNSLFGEDPVAAQARLDAIREALAKLNREVDASQGNAASDIAASREAGERSVSGFVLQRKPMGLSERLGAGANRQIGLANLAAPLPFSFKGAKQESSEFSQHMKSGFMSATGQLTQGFVQAFGLANNLAGQLLATLMAAASQALIIMGLRAVGNYISPGLGTALFGEGGSGKGSAAPSGSPTPISAERSGGYGGGIPVRVEVVGAIKNDVIALSNRRGSTVLSGRTY